MFLVDSPFNQARGESPQAGELFKIDHPHPWRVLHVKSRQEKALSQELASLSIQHYLPLMVTRRMRGQQKIVVEKPVFPGYIFLRGPVDDAYRADRTRRVAKILRVADQARLNSELFNLEFALRSQVPLTAHAWLKAGVGVEIVNGPLRGLRGLVQNLQSMDRVVLQVNMLGQAVSIEMDPSDVEPLTM
jgi:transcription antitermination factor NusG